MDLSVFAPSPVIAANATPITALTQPKASHEIKYKDSSNKNFPRELALETIHRAPEIKEKLGLNLDNQDLVIGLTGLIVGASIMFFPAFLSMQNLEHKFSKREADLVNKINTLIEQKNSSELVLNSALNKDEQELLRRLVSETIKENIANVLTKNADYQGYDSYFSRYSQAISQEVNEQKKLSLLKKMLYLPEETDQKLTRKFLLEYIKFFNLAKDQSGVAREQFDKETTKKISDSLARLIEIDKETKSVLK